MTVPGKGIVMDADQQKKLGQLKRWREEDHPRAGDGRFTSGGGASSKKRAGNTLKNASQTQPKQATGTINKTVQPVAKEKAPEITDKEAAQVRQSFKAGGYPEKDYQAVTDKVDKVIKANGNKDGSYDLRTGKPLNFTDGYGVSFQVNKAPGVRRDYKDEEYDRYVYECSQRSGSMPFVGNYNGVAEISFNCKSKKEALKMAKDYNQESIFDVKRKRLRKNPYYNSVSNPQ